MRVAVQPYSLMDFYLTSLEAGLRSQSGRLGPRRIVQVTVVLAGSGAGSGPARIEDRSLRSH